MSLQSLSRRTLVAYASPQAFVPRTAEILARLGYEILTPEAYEAHLLREDHESATPDLLIADERRIAEVPEFEGEAPPPLVLLTGQLGATGADPRVVGALKRPAGLHELYRLVQQVFEDTPRSTPRVPTHLRARCRRKGMEWHGVVLSLSENGCLLRTGESLPLGGTLQLGFELPRSGFVELEAETAYQLVPDLGLVFSAIDPGARAALQKFVTNVLDG